MRGHRKEVKLKEVVRLKGLYTILTKVRRFRLWGTINLWVNDLEIHGGKLWRIRAILIRFIYADSPQCWLSKQFSETFDPTWGIWTGHLSKIAAIGIRVRKWIAYHGFSLNVNNDLSKYKKITPCGIKDKGVTSLQEMGIKNFHNIDKIIIKKFLNTFL